ncbi:sodium- and chloride-dependent neutral and basic amino acid transporter B(0+)-like [Anneissia japonica]|uniref:sodium- and chloride-dependent neutral and basic amino acid transporter B(0+)-like n=1 Tax=Anneissia japonica TaxID=1529436 RepID=UPI0014256F7B|nr:sodium- and chloride-dependent neutral and basic amino acid transporter B(0+)-like [Anneissia japonica]
MSSAKAELVSGDENTQRGNWSNKMDFLLSCLGYAVGLGNVWRFPYLCYRNGGGAFLIPYLIMLAFAGLPLFFLEVSFGQYCSQGPITAWRACPAFRGVGYGMMVVSSYVAIYYNVIIMYAIYYLFSSFTSTLPWIGCNHSWNTPMCSEKYTDCIAGKGIIALNASCIQLDNMTATDLEFYNITPTFETYDLSIYRDPFEGMRKRATEEFWKEKVLVESDSMNEPGRVVWQLALCLLLAWLIVFFCLVRGIKSSGKVVYFTATFPYLVLFILLIRGATLPGHLDGIKFFIVPKFDRLSDPQVWLDAAVQIFYSLSAAWGGLLTLASYNKFHNNCFFDSMFVAIANCCTSVFAGFVIFSIIGYMANQLGKPVEEVVDQGFGLAFIAYPEAVASLPGAPFWAILFFFMLLTLGLDSQFAIMETIVTSICDEFPYLHKKKTYVLGIACGVGYFLGFSCITEAGPYWVSMMDSYGASFALLMFALCESIAISWIYGLKRFMNDIRTMVGNKIVDHPLFIWWGINWCTITPALLAFIIVFNWMSWTEPTYNGDYPGWANGIGWCMIISSIMWIPIIWIYELFRGSGTVLERLQQMTSPRANWGPALQHHRDEAWAVHKSHNTTMGGLLKVDGIPLYADQSGLFARFIKDGNKPGFNGGYGNQPGNGSVDNIQFVDDEQDQGNPRSEGSVQFVYEPRSYNANVSQYADGSFEGSRDGLDLQKSERDAPSIDNMMYYNYQGSRSPSHHESRDNLDHVTAYPASRGSKTPSYQGSQDMINGGYSLAHRLPPDSGPSSHYGSRDYIPKDPPTSHPPPRRTGPPSRHGSRDVLNKDSVASFPPPPGSYYGSDSSLNQDDPPVYPGPRGSNPPSLHGSRDVLNHNYQKPLSSGPPSRHGSRDVLNQNYQKPLSSGPPSRHGSRDVLNQNHQKPLSSGPPSRHGSRDVLNQQPLGSGPPSRHGSRDILNHYPSSNLALRGSGPPSLRSSHDQINLDYMPRNASLSSRQSSVEHVNAGFEASPMVRRPPANQLPSSKKEKDKKGRWSVKKSKKAGRLPPQFDSPMELDFESDC